MSVDLVIRGGKVAHGKLDVGDVHVENGRIADVVAAGTSVPKGARVIDASGCVVMPGMVDLGVHLRDPGREEDEPLAETLRAALRGGVTTFVALPDTDPCVDGSDDVLHRRAAIQRALGPDVVTPDVIIAGCLTKKRAGKEPADIADMAAAGVRVFTDATYIDDADVLRRSLEYVRGACPDALAILPGPMRDLAAGGVVVESAVSTKLGLPGVPEMADALAAARNTAIASLARVRAHCGPLFAGLAVGPLGEEATGHVDVWHLLLDERAHLERRYDPLLRLDPPLPSSSSALRGAVKSAGIAISSGHRAVPNRTKDLEFAIAEPGATSLALTLPLLLGLLTPLQLATAAAAIPAEILKLADRGRIENDARADLVVIRENVDDVVDAKLVGSRSPANPWLGRKIHNRVECTIVNGRVAYEWSRS